MEASPANRRLAAILAADVAGYSRLMADDEEATLRTLATYRRAVWIWWLNTEDGFPERPAIACIVEFSSAVNSVRAAVAIQRALP